MRTLVATATAVLLCSVMTADRVGARQAKATEAGDGFHDAHFHLTNYVQQGITARDFLKIMGTRVGRSTLFGIPLQQQWSYGNSGDYAPTYYLQSDAPIYYSFTDAFIAAAYRSLPPRDHERFVSAKVAGATASLTNPAPDRILDFVGEAGLVAIIHNDIDMPFAKTDASPAYLEQMIALLKRHPDASIIWAHVGLGRIVRPVRVSAEAAERSASHVEIVEAMLTDPALRHVSFDISWDEVAKYAVASPESVSRVAAVLNRFPDRFLFGTDTVAPPGPAPYYAVYDMWKPVWDRLTVDASFQIRKGHYERLFNESRLRVRSWERANVN